MLYLLGKGGRKLASSIDFVEFVVEQLADAGEIRYRRMFGEYGIYCDDKYFAVICNNQLFVKITDEGGKIVPNCSTEPPYKGAKPMFLIEDLDNKVLLEQLTVITCSNLFTKKKRK